MRQCFVVALACAALAGPLHAQVPSDPASRLQNEPTVLKPGKPLERSLQGGETHVYAIHAEAGQFLYAIVDQLGIDVALTLYSPDGKPIGSMDSPNGNFGLEQLSTIAEAPGMYRLAVASGDKTVPAGRYRVTVDPLRLPSGQDRARVTAERMFVEAEQLRGQGSADSFKMAIQKYLASLPLWRIAADRYEEALAESGVGLVYTALGENQKALDYLNQALPLQRAVGDRAGEAGALTNIGVAYAALGEMQKALDYYTQALPLERAVGDHLGEAATLYNIGFVYSQLGEKQKALESYSQALLLQRIVGYRTGEAATLCSIGLVYSALGELQKALEYYTQALPLERAVGDHLGEAATLTNIGNVYSILGEPQKTLEQYSQALLIVHAVGYRTGEATTLTNIGNVYSILGEKQKALDYYAQALPLQRAVGDRVGEALTLTDIGVVYADLGEKQKALDYYTQALALERTVGYRMGEANTLNDIGRVYADLGENQKALDFYTQALPLFRAVQDPLGEAKTLTLLMDYWKRLQHPSLAVLFGKQAIDRFQQVRRNITGLEKTAQQSFLTSKGRYYRELAELLIGQGRLPEAEQVLDLLKAEEYADFTQRRGAAGAETEPVALTPREKGSTKDYEHLTGEITAIGEEWSQLHTKRSRSADEDHRYDELSNQLQAANQRLQAFFTTLYDSYGKGDQASAKVRAVDEETAHLKTTLVGELGAGTVAIYTLVLDQKCVLMVITPATRVAREVPISKVDLRTQVFAFLGALVRHQADDEIHAKAQALYQVLIAPIEHDLQGAQATTLVWSLDDVLRYVPLAALYDGTHYLVERYRTVVITTASAGNLKDQPHVDQWHGAAMGVSRDYDGLGALRAVPGELAAVVRSDTTPGSHGPVPGTILLDDAFTETGLARALAQHPPLVHIASHYVFNQGDDTHSYLLLGGKETGGQGFHLTLAALRDDPRMDFTGVELLTLSGCQTALGSNDSDGREIDGLGWTAQKNGAKAVVATLWAVDDASVGLLMANFYKLWVTTPGLTKAEALRQAQLTLLHGATDAAGTASGAAARGLELSGGSARRPAPGYANPYYWAPFVLIGNWK